MLPITIRPEAPEDYESLLKLTYEAFETLELPGRTGVDEHYLLCLLKDSPLVLRELCFVAELDGEIVGHIFYTPSQVLRPDGTALDTITFGPLSVAVPLQRRGIGAALVRHTLELAKALGHGAVCITGIPEYYPRLGFRRGREFGITLPDGSSPDALMVYELIPGYLTGGVLRFLPLEFEHCEKDTPERAAFHTKFMAKHYPAAAKPRKRIRLRNAAAIGIIGSADGPTRIWVTKRPKEELPAAMTIIVKPIPKPVKIGLLLAGTALVGISALLSLGKGKR